MVEDKNGFLWLGTRDGLNRYDGNKFLYYLPDAEDSASLAFNQITALTIDAAGRLWIGATDGISLYHPEFDNFSNFPFDSETDPNTEVTHIFASDTSLILSTNNGLRIFDTRKRKFYPDGLYREFQGKFTSQFHTSEQFGTWVAGNNGLRYKPSSESVWKTLLNDTIVYDILFDEKGIFVSTHLGLYKFDLPANGREHIALPLDHSQVYQVVRSSSGELWVASEEVVVLDPKDDRTVKAILSHDRQKNHTISENRVRVLYETSDQTMWLGTIGYGLNKFNPATNSFGYLGDGEGLKLSSNYISGIYTGDDEEIFIGTSRGLNVVNLEKKTQEVLLNNGGMNLIFKMQADSTGVLWISSTNGLYRYKNRKFTRINFATWVVSGFNEMNDSTLLVTTLSRGIFLLDRKKDKMSLLIPVSALPRNTHVTHLYQDHIWVGSDDGLRIFSRDGALKRHLRAMPSRPGSLPADVIKTICEDSRGRLWIGTWGGGLCLFNSTDSTFKTYDRRSDLPNNVVYGILEDSLGNLWISTNAGISSFDPRSESFTNFDFIDGLQGDEFNTNAYFKSPNGKLYFGGIDGLSFFDPENVLSIKAERVVKLVKVLVNDREFPLNPDKSQNTVDTDWKTNNIGVEFTAVDFRRPDKVQFQYSVNDEVWLNLGSRRNLELVNLPPGRHVVKLRAKAGGGSWLNTPAILTVNVSPPFWRDPSVLTVAGVGLLAIVYFGYRTRIRFLKNINGLLNKTVQARTREIQMKNEELTRGSELLAEQNLLLEKQGRELLDLSNDLEKKVEQRTKDIQLLNEELTEQKQSA